MPTADINESDPELAAVLNQALDELLHLVELNDGSVFGSKGERIGVAHGISKKSRKQWAKKRICIFPGCKEKTLEANSHTIQRGGPLTVIADAKHVLSPRFDLTAKGVTMERLGVGEASTFSGFCSKHELLFAPFEQTGRLEKNEHIALQIFRIICRELVRTEWHMNGLLDSVATFDAAASKQGHALIHKHLTESGTSMNDLNIGEISVSSEMRNELLRRSDEMKQMHSLLKESYFKQALADVQGADGGLAHFVINVEETFPVCLAGLGNFHVQIEEKIQIVFAILNVWPTRHGTMISMAVPSEHKDSLESYIGHQLNGFLGLVTMLETWMIHGTDHWFVNPSVWNKIPQKRQLAILDDIFDENHSIASPYTVSIFDDLRSKGLVEYANEYPPHEVELERNKLELGENGPLKTIHDHGQSYRNAR